MDTDFAKQNRQVVVFKMLANANRLQILRLVISAKESGVSVNEIAAQLKLSAPKTSDHLKLLRIHKIVKAKQSGTKMLYSLKDPAIVKMLGVAL